MYWPCLRKCSYSISKYFYFINLPTWECYIYIFFWKFIFWKCFLTWNIAIKLVNIFVHGNNDDWFMVIMIIRLLTILLKIDTLTRKFSLFVHFFAITCEINILLIILLLLLRRLARMVRSAYISNLLLNFSFCLMLTVHFWYLLLLFQMITWTAYENNSSNFFSIN